MRFLDAVEILGQTFGCDLREDPPNCCLITIDALPIQLEKVGPLLHCAALLGSPQNFSSSALHQTLTFNASCSSQAGFFAYWRKAHQMVLGRSLHLSTLTPELFLRFLNDFLPTA